MLLLFGRKDAPGVDKALARVRETFAGTAQGPAWHCIPDPVAKWRGPGRKNDACLQVTVEALRLFGLVDATERPKQLAGAARTLLGAWRNRTREKPYMFGHGQRFVLGKWPPTWYDASAVLEALGPYPSIWKGTTASAEDKTAHRRSSEPSRPRSVPMEWSRQAVLLQGLRGLLLHDTTTDTFSALTDTAPTPAARGLLTETLGSVTIPATATWVVDQTLAFIPIVSALLVTELS